MPSITLEMAHLTKDQKREIVSGVTEVASRVSGIPAEMFYVFIKENEPDNIGVGGVLLSDKNKA